VRAVSPRAAKAAVKPGEPVRITDLTPPDVQVVPAEQRSKWARKIALGEFVTSVEVLPPKGCDAAKTLNRSKLLKIAGVDAVNIPDGPRAQTQNERAGDGDFSRTRNRYRSRSALLLPRPQSLGMMSDLLGAAALGVHNY
jgi:homocysteine S-methyltransferase